MTELIKRFRRKTFKRSRPQPIKPTNDDVLICHHLWHLSRGGERQKTKRSDGANHRWGPCVEVSIGLY